MKGGRVGAGDTTPPQAQTPGPPRPEDNPQRLQHPGQEPREQAGCPESSTHPVLPLPSGHEGHSSRPPQYARERGGEPHVKLYVASQHFCPSPPVPTHSCSPSSARNTLPRCSHSVQAPPRRAPPAPGTRGHPSHMDTPTLCCPWGFPDRFCGELGALASLGSL